MLLPFDDEPLGNGDVLLLEPPSAPAVGQCASALERKRRAVWNNRRRNRHVARVARAIAKPSAAKLTAAGIPEDFGDYITGGLLWIVVLVESLEHARALQPRLPGFFFDDPAGGKPGTSFPASLLTLMQAASLDSFEPGVLVNAMGGRWICDLPNFPTARFHRSKLVVDLIDEEDEAARRDTESRKQAYMNENYRVFAPSRASTWKHLGRRLGLHCLPSPL